MYLKTIIYVIIFLFPSLVLVRDLKDKNFREQSKKYQIGTYIMLSLYVVFAVLSAYFYIGDLKASSEMTERLEKLSSDNQGLRDQITSLSRELAGAYKDLSNSQGLLLEKAETQVDMQQQLRVKTEENALLNSQIANLQSVSRKKAENQIESQNLLKDKVQESALLNSQIAKGQREQNQVVREIKNSIVDIKNALTEQGIITAETLEKGKHHQMQADSLEVVVRMEDAKLFQTGQNVTISNGKHKHIFDGDLSISVNIDSVGNKKRPFLRALLSIPGKDFHRIKTDKSGYITTYEKYVIKINSISSQSSRFYYLY